ncbi:MAG: GNAT family N-acetyltransferase [Planctomycetes bacterium]|nr:GNAT family N-acetyltransferase [Planctomycetota bacterium]
MSDRDGKQSVTVRRAKLSDVDVITDFNIRLAKETEDVDLQTDVVRIGVKRCLEDESKGWYFLAEADGEIAGQTLLTFEWSDWRNAMYLWIQSVYVDERFRRKGVFRALYEHVQELSRKPGYCGLRLYVIDSNKRAIETYKNLGMVSHGYLLLETNDVLR